MSAKRKERLMFAGKLTKQSPARRLLSFLEEKKRSLSPQLVLTHNHPDPDAIASAWAYAFLAERLYKVKTLIGYAGIIGRMENQMMVKLLKIPMKVVSAHHFERAGAVVLVDTQPPFQNNCFPSRRRATVIIDHHPKHVKSKADLIIIDETAGATTTLLTEALLAAGLDIPSRLATAMVYGIGSETQHLGRDSSARDVEAYRHLFPKANMRTLARIQNPTRPRTFFTTLGRAMQEAFVIRGVIGVHLGSVPNQDIVAHMADLLITHEQMRWSVVTGRYVGKLCVSLRTRSRGARAGRLLWKLLGGGTSAGGHSMIAGGAIMVGDGKEEAVWREAEESFLTKFLRVQKYKEPFEFEYPFRVIHDEGEYT